MMKSALLTERSRGTVEWTKHDVSTQLGSVSFRHSRGKGVPVVLLGGGKLSKGVFDAFIDGNVAEKYQLINLDFSNHNYPLFTDSEVSFYAEATLEVLEYLDIDYAAVLGHSFGFFVANKLASIFNGLLELGWGVSCQFMDNPIYDTSRPRRRSTPVEYGSSDNPEYETPQHIPVTVVTLHTQTQSANVLSREDTSVLSFHEFLQEAEQLHQRRLAEPTTWYGG